MTRQNKKTSFCGCIFIFLLIFGAPTSLVLMTLKLVDYIDWNWLWVLLPLFSGPIFLFILFFVILGALVIIELTGVDK